MPWVYHGGGAPAGSNNPVVDGDLTVTGKITSGGKVGVETASPAFDLDVNPPSGAVAIRAKGDSVSLVLEHTPANHQSAVSFRENGIDKFIAGVGVYSADATNFDIGTNAASLFRIQSGGNMGNTMTPTSKLHIVGLPVFANNAAAIAGGLTAGAFYRTGADPDPVFVVH